MSPEGIVSDGVVGFVPEPVGQGSILSLLFGQSLLDEQTLLGSHLFN